MRGFFSFSLPALITVCSVYQQYCRRSSEIICWLQNLNRIHCWSWRQGNQLPCQVEANHGSAREVAGSGGSQQSWEGCGTWKKGKMYKHKEELGTCRLPLWGCPPADQQTSVISSPPSNSIHLDETNGNTSATSYPPVLQPEVQHPCKENHPGRIHLYPVPEKNRITLTTSSQTLSTLFSSDQAANISGNLNLPPTLQGSFHIVKGDLVHLPRHVGRKTKHVCAMSDVPGKQW